MTKEIVWRIGGLSVAVHDDSDQTIGVGVLSDGEGNTIYLNLDDAEEIAEAILTIVGKERGRK
jgi:hypothetical protein